MSEMMSQSEKPLQILTFYLLPVPRVGGSSPFRCTIQKPLKMPVFQGFLAVFSYFRPYRSRTKKDKKGHIRTPIDVKNDVKIDVNFLPVLVDILIPSGLGQFFDVSAVDVLVNGHHSGRGFTMSAPVFLHQFDNFLV